MSQFSQLENILNFYDFSPTLATGGQPSAEQLAAIRDAGFEIVVNLALPTSTHALADEAEIVAGLGLEYIPIPVVWEHPTLDDLERFFAVMEANRQRPIFVHCALNYRVSTFMYLYRVLRLDVPHDEAIWDLRSIWEPDETWSAFIKAALDIFIR